MEQEIESKHLISSVILFVTCTILRFLDSQALSISIFTLFVFVSPVSFTRGFYDSIKSITLRIMYI